MPGYNKEWLDIMENVNIYHKENVKTLWRKENVKTQLRIKGHTEKCYDIMENAMTMSKA